MTTKLLCLRFCVVSVIQTRFFVFQTLLLPMSPLRNNPGFHPYFSFNWCLVRTGQGPACRNVPSFVALRGISGNGEICGRKD